MTPSDHYQQAVARLRDVLVLARSGQIQTSLDPAIDSEKEVQALFQPLFEPTRLPELTEAEFRSFLLFKNNRHWSGLHRLGPRMCADMNVLRDALAVLLDETRPIAERYDYTISRVHGMGRAVATAVLMIVYPDRYGVWNTTSEAGIKALNLWPAFERGEPEGRRYERINGLLNALSRDVGVSLWVLDGLWWYVLRAQDGPDAPEPEPEPDDGDVTLFGGESGQRLMHRFGLERHLQDFLWDNWAQTELAEWERYTEPGNDRAGYEYPCDVGRIDILARHPGSGDWLVMELKREQTSDMTVGQVLRYMGWVRRHLAAAGENVRGLIVAREGDDRLSYAVDMLTNVDVKLYEVKFTLVDAPQLD